MAITKTCDRCGKVMKFGALFASGIEMNFRTKSILGFETTRNELFDLCAECTEDFRKFLNDKTASD